MTETLYPTRLAPAPDSRLLVVGGCGGIGRVLVNVALAAGIRVAVADLPSSMEKHPPPSGVLRFPADATKGEEVRETCSRLHEAWRGLDSLVNLAGFSNELKDVADLDEQEFDDIVAGSLKSTFLFAKYSLPLLRLGNAASIVHMASGLATNVRAGFGPYGAAKAAVITLTKAIARENAPAVRANVVAPGAVDTEFFAGGTGRSVKTIAMDRETYVKAIPLARLARPVDVVGPILFLLGQGSAYMTGQVLYINGGALTP